MDLILETLASFTQKKNVLQQANELGNDLNFISGTLAAGIHCGLNLVCVVRHRVAQRHPTPSVMEGLKLWLQSQFIGCAPCYSCEQQEQSFGALSVTHSCSQGSSMFF